ncbi:MAG TPA: hypothetical protein DE312_00100 [Gallionella sp.]|nr:hypothetical protein [Gallionella sp.]
MKKNMMCLLSALAVFTLLSGVALAEPQLYETGPSEESSFVRFVNATDADVAIATAKGKEKVLGTKPDARVTRFFKIKSGAKLSATIQGKAGRVAIEVVGKPWEFITVAVLPSGAKQIKTSLLRETPSEFSGTRVSLALLNLDAKCSSANMNIAEKNAAAIYEVKPLAMQRHLTGSDKQSGAVNCSGSATPVDLSGLESGSRYSLFLLTANNTRQAFVINDDKK